MLRVRGRAIDLLAADLPIMQEHDGEHRVTMTSCRVRRSNERRITDGAPVAVLATHAAGADAARAALAKTAKGLTTRHAKRLAARQHGLQDVATGLAQHFIPDVPEHLFGAVIPLRNVALPVDGKCGVGRQSDHFSQSDHALLPALVDFERLGVVERNAQRCGRDFV